MIVYLYAISRSHKRWPEVKKCAMYMVCFPVYSLKGPKWTLLNSKSPSLCNAITVAEWMHSERLLNFESDRSLLGDLPKIDGRILPFLSRLAVSGQRRRTKWSAKSGRFHSLFAVSRIVRFVVVSLRLILLWESLLLLLLLRDDVVRFFARRHLPPLYSIQISFLYIIPVSLL